MGLVLSCLLLPVFCNSFAQEDPPEAVTFPGVNEVVPRATAVAAKLTEADAQINKAASREAHYQTLDTLMLGKP